ncbi:unnamed protein product [Protopolystoma xenopodis]|uniref:Uncharacterized protein n=1 Tax=Protopolystoma xenopodis TaxID=117903 RepID=A0A3S5CEF8_9PLAT|nr:unnamed protein product [Protopolystoma xenopodis]
MSRHTNKLQVEVVAAAVFPDIYNILGLLPGRVDARLAASCRLFRGQPMMDGSAKVTKVSGLFQSPLRDMTLSKVQRQTRRHASQKAHCSTRPLSLLVSSPCSRQGGEREGRGGKTGRGCQGRSKLVESVYCSISCRCARVTQRQLLSAPICTVCWQVGGLSAALIGWLYHEVNKPRSLYHWPGR